MKRSAILESFKEPFLCATDVYRHVEFVPKRVVFLTYSLTDSCKARDAYGMGPLDSQYEFEGK